MHQVAHLSKGVVEKYRKSRAGRLKRTFIGAGDAVIARLKKSDAPRTLGLGQNTSSETTE